MAKYGQQDVTFPSTREAKFVNTLIGAINASDKEAFTAAVFEYDQVCASYFDLDNAHLCCLGGETRQLEDWHTTED
jgi:hypothetical protein